MVCTDQPGNTPARALLSDRPAPTIPPAATGSARSLPRGATGSRGSNLRPRPVSPSGAAASSWRVRCLVPRGSRCATIGPSLTGCRISIRDGVRARRLVHALKGYWSRSTPGASPGALRRCTRVPTRNSRRPPRQNLIIFVAALACFDYLLASWMEDQQARTAASSRRAGSH